MLIFDVIYENVFTDRCRRVHAHFRNLPAYSDRIPLRIFLFSENPDLLTVLSGKGTKELRTNCLVRQPLCSFLIRSYSSNKLYISSVKYVFILVFTLYAAPTPIQV